MSMKCKDQIAFLVQKDGAETVAWWIEYEIRGTLRNFAVVLRPVQALLPRTKLGIGLAENEYGISRDGMSAWLEEKGYRILSSMNS